MYAPVGGTYLFASYYWVDGIVYVEIDGTVVADLNTPGGDYSGTVSLTEGTWVPVLMTFASNGGSNKHATVLVATECLLGSRVPLHYLGTMRDCNGNDLPVRDATLIAVRGAGRATCRVAVRARTAIRTTCLMNATLPPVPRERAAKPYSAARASICTTTPWRSFLRSPPSFPVLRFSSMPLPWTGKCGHVIRCFRRARSRKLRPTPWWPRSSIRARSAPTAIFAIGVTDGSLVVLTQYGTTGGPEGDPTCVSYPGSTISGDTITLGAPRICSTP